MGKKRESLEITAVAVEAKYIMCRPHLAWAKSKKKKKTKCYNYMVQLHKRSGFMLLFDSYFFFN